MAFPDSFDSPQTPQSPPLQSMVAHADHTVRALIDNDLFGLAWRLALAAVVFRLLWRRLRPYLVALDAQDQSVRTPAFQRSFARTGWLCFVVILMASCVADTGPQGLTDRFVLLLAP